MMTSPARRWLIPLHLTTAVASTVAAQPPTVGPATGEITFLPVSALPYDPTQPAVLGARAADPKDYPASFYTAQHEGRCTSTVVGPRVLLTAAHCVGDGGTATLLSANQRYVATCTHAPDYAWEPSADYALCLLDRVLPGIPYERVSIERARLRPGLQLLLTGFGCTRPDGTGGNDGVYRVGESPVYRLPSGSNNHIVTAGGAALCFGDSGGPAFRFLDPFKRSRTQVSVNSRGNIRDSSWLSSLSTGPAVAFLREWSLRHGARICGVHADVQGCR
jgi:hypothetical protein